jgi:hypothetical protein
MGDADRPMMPVFTGDGGSLFRFSGPFYRNESRAVGLSRDVGIDLATGAGASVA